MAHKQKGDPILPDACSTSDLSKCCVQFKTRIEDPLSSGISQITALSNQKLFFCSHQDHLGRTAAILRQISSDSLVNHHL